MKVKVGKWVRTNRGLIGQVRHINNDYFNTVTLRTVSKGVLLSYELVDIYKIKDTPQELLQVGDLVFIKSYWQEPVIVSYIDNNGNPRANVRTSSGSESIDLSRKNITKILTPNSNGGFDLQWEVE